MSASVAAGGAAAAAFGPAPAPAAPARLPLILELARQLESAGISYCHWKSNTAIARSLSGENDLDLLVHRDDAARFAELLLSVGFVRTRKRGSDFSGIESFYGFDADADRLVHVHTHYRLVLGDDRTKNYVVPIEDAYIASATRPDVLPVPSPELELAVLVVRMILKYSTWDEILWCALRGRRAGPKRSEREELADLTSRADAERTAAVLAAWLPGGLFTECVAALAPGASVARRVRTARRLEIALQANARRSRTADRLLRIAGRIVVAAARRVRALPRNRLIGGGVMVAVTGGDGSGKTTALGTLGRWLGTALDVRVVHLGKPRWSVTTYAVRAALKAAFLVTAPVRPLARRVDEYRRLFWFTCTARDRRREYRRARRFADDGGVVLCDRYPHPRLRSMDVPQIDRLTAGRLDNRLVRMLNRLEHGYHADIAAPELMIVLRVDPEIAVQRKTDERPESVRARGAEVWNIDWNGSGAQVVDASRDEHAVARDLKALVWAKLAGGRR